MLEAVLGQQQSGKGPEAPLNLAWDPLSSAKPFRKPKRFLLFRAQLQLCTTAHVKVSIKCALKIDEQNPGAAPQAGKRPLFSAPLLYCSQHTQHCRWRLQPHTFVSHHSLLVWTSRLYAEKQRSITCSRHIQPCPSPQAECEHPTYPPNWSHF